MRALFHHPCGEWLRERLEALAADGLQVEIVAEADGPALRDALSRAEVLLHVLHPVTAPMMDAAPDLALIQKIGVGLDAIDREAARARGIAVCNMPGTNTGAVVEATLGLMLSVLRRIPEQDARLRAGAGGWALPPSAQGAFGEIAGRTVALVGYGAVARRLARVLAALGAEVIVVSRRPIADPAVTRVDKDEALARADILSLHVPDAPETRGWLDAGAFARMKPGAVVINTARGTLVDEAALIDALGSGRLAGAGLDVFAAEPLPPDAPILSAPNTVVQPHLAWLTRETFERSLAAVLRNIEALRTGAPLANRH